METDHIRCRALHGSDEPSNKQRICGECHTYKSRTETRLLMPAKRRIVQLIQDFGEDLWLRKLYEKEGEKMPDITEVLDFLLPSGSIEVGREFMENPAYYTKRTAGSKKKRRRGTLGTLGALGALGTPVTRKGEAVQLEVGVQKAGNLGGRTAVSGVLTFTSPLSVLCSAAASRVHSSGPPTPHVRRPEQHLSIPSAGGRMFGEAAQAAQFRGPAMEKEEEDMAALFDVKATVDAAAPVDASFDRSQSSLHDFAFTSTSRGTNPLVPQPTDSTSPVSLESTGPSTLSSQSPPASSDSPALQGDGADDNDGGGANGARRFRTLGITGSMGITGSTGSKKSRVFLIPAGKQVENHRILTKNWMWAFPATKEKMWNKMREGDLFMFTASGTGRFQWVARVHYLKRHTVEDSDAVWGRDTNNNSFPLFIYFSKLVALDPVHARWKKAAVLRTCGYLNSHDRLMGLREVREDYVESLAGICSSVLGGGEVSAAN